MCQDYQELQLVVSWRWFILAYESQVLNFSEVLRAGQHCIDNLKLAIMEVSTPRESAKWQIKHAKVSC